ncbi:hypothetical protein [Celeribacter persicus]|jgi:hypothetical protein|uniref:Uncharacterized protein n=1 Tax=Celeribacter persicus TaxID=1651082 RepID=A0A2T5HVN2_9RHOB|nr:hypothetical protein [Celeribacter persicus]PTQ75653.1 hypothetical protein C8N42_101192 [Celeribacter persicus]
MPHILPLTALALILATPALADCEWSINHGIDSYNKGINQKNEAGSRLNKARQADLGGDVFTAC